MWKAKLVLQYCDHNKDQKKNIQNPSVKNRWVEVHITSKYWLVQILQCNDETGRFNINFLGMNESRDH